MAAGRHGGYRDHDFRERELEQEVSKRKEYHLDRRRDGDRDRGRGRDLGARVRDRQGDVKKWESMNGYENHRHRHSPVNGSQSGGSVSSGDDRRTSQLSQRLVDREPGELSSGSGSDDPVAADGAQDKENGNLLPSPSNKRKFSPIVWDKDDGKKSSVANSRIRKEPTEFVELPPPPPLPHGYIPPTSVEVADLTKERASDVLPLDVNGSISSPHNPRLEDDLEPGQMEEDEDEDHMPRHISSSRWADGDDDEDEMETRRRKKNSSPADLANKKMHKKVQSPELGEVVREGSGGSAPKSSDSGEHGEEYEDLDVNRNDYMDIDEENAENVLSDKMSETESEGEDSRAETLEPTQPPQRYINMLQGCRSVDEFERLNKIDEGTYGVVYRARDKKTNEVVALKKVKMEKEREGFPLTSLREINILLSFHHPSVVDVKEVVVGSSLDSIFMVMEYMEHDLKALMETMKHPFSQSEVKCLMLQLLEGVKYLHDNWVLHRDLKTSNLLMNNCGELKICDFGLSRQYGSPLKPYTQLVVTLWYRAPELLFGAKDYSTAIDMWSLGCIMAELLAKEPLFNGKTEVDQLDKIFRILGTPNEKIWPGFAKLPRVKVNFVKQPYNKLREKFPATSFTGRPTLSEAGFDLLNKLLTYDPEKRISAEEALKHDWFREVPPPKSKDFMPTFPAQHAQDRRLRRTMKSPDPLEEQRKKELQQGELGTRGLFG